MSGEDGGTAPTRLAALRVLRRVTDGAYADRALQGEVHGLTPEERRQVHRLVFGSVQRRRTLDWLIDQAVSRPLGLEPAVRDILRMGAYEVVFSDGVPAPIVVDQAVRLARSLPGPPARRSARAGVVNAVMRRIAGDGRRDTAALDDRTWERAAVRHSVPDWIARRLFDALGPDDARGVLAAANEPAESSVRWNPLRGSREELETLLPDGAAADAVVDDAYLLPGPFALEHSPIWDRGLAMGQSRASMLPALALAPVAGERILDLCSAPGAKATQLAGMAGNQAEIVCVEVRPARAASLRELADRLGARLTVVEGDGRDVALEGTFDAVLVDPPCTGLGVMSARPDSRWRRDEKDLPDLIDLQTALLRRASDVVRAGGRIVYSTCTLLPDENEEVVTALGLPVDDLTRRFRAFAHPEAEGMLRTLPHVHGTDGFFVGRINVPDR